MLGIGIVLSRLIINIIPLKIIKLIYLYSRNEICMNQEEKKQLRIGCEGTTSKNIISKNPNTCKMNFLYIYSTHKLYV